MHGFRCLRLYSRRQRRPRLERQAPRFTPQRSRRVLSVLDTRGSEDEEEVQLGASDAARATLAALEVERGEDAAGGADRDELIEEKAAGARLSVEHDPAGQRGARRAGRMQMKRE